MAISDADLWHQVHAQREDGIAAMFLIRDVEPRPDQPQIVVVQLPYPVGDESRLPDPDSYRRLDEFQERWIEPACEVLGWTFVAWKSEDGSFYLYLYGDGDPNALVERLTPFDAELSFYNDQDAEWSEYATLRELVEQAEMAPDDEDDEDEDDHEGHDHGDHDHDHGDHDHDHVHAHADDEGSDPAVTLKGEDDEDDHNAKTSGESDDDSDDSEPAHLSNGHSHASHHHAHAPDLDTPILRPGRSTRAATVGELPSNVGAKQQRSETKRAAAKPAIKSAAVKSAGTPATKGTMNKSTATKPAPAKKPAISTKKPAAKKSAAAKKPAKPMPAAKKPAIAKKPVGKKTAAPAKKPAAKKPVAKAKPRAARR